MDVRTYERRNEHTDTLPRLIYRDLRSDFPRNMTRHSDGRLGERCQRAPGCLLHVKMVTTRNSSGDEMANVNFYYDDNK